MKSHLRLCLAACAAAAGFGAGMRFFPTMPFNKGLMDDGKPLPPLPINTGIPPQDLTLYRGRQSQRQIRRARRRIQRFPR